VIVDHDNTLLFNRLRGLLHDPPEHNELAVVINGSGIGKGSLQAPELFELLKNRYGSSARRQDFLAAWSCHFSLNHSVFSLLQLISAKRPIVICSNTNSAHWDFIVKHYAVDSLAAQAVLSHECGYEKPEPEIYLLAAAAHGVEPEQCLFVDDVAANIEGAKALGFQTHHFTEVEGLRRILEM
jgi:putative hydrolase of the HAD superfamily